MASTRAIMQDTMEQWGPTNAGLCPNKVALPTDGRLTDTDFLTAIAK